MRLREPLKRSYIIHQRELNRLRAIDRPVSYSFSGASLSMSAIRLSSGSERACIFRITWVRCTFTVDSAMPISLAICLLRRPAVTPVRNESGLLSSKNSKDK